MSSHSFSNQDPSPAELDEVSRSAYERRIQRLEDERKELVRKLTDTNIALQKMAHGSTAASPGSPTKNNEVAADSNKAAAASSEKSGAEVRKLQDEVSLSFRCTRLISVEAIRTHSSKTTCNDLQSISLIFGKDFVQLRSSAVQLVPRKSGWGYPVSVTHNLLIRDNSQITFTKNSGSFSPFSS